QSHPETKHRLKKMILPIAAGGDVCEHREVEVTKKQNRIIHAQGPRPKSVASNMAGFVNCVSSRPKPLSNVPVCMLCVLCKLY
ncbi:hypothetical protein ACQP3C_29635, partial [Escherichia coli]